MSGREDAVPAMLHDDSGRVFGYDALPLAAILIVGFMGMVARSFFPGDK